MFKRIMSVMLAIVMLMSVAMIATSAAQVEIADNSADAVADVSADGTADTGTEAGADTGAEGGADTAAANTISFNVSTANWNNFSKVFCHVWAYDGSGDWPSWQSKAERAEYDEASGIATYDLSKTGNSIDSGVLYAVIFSVDTGMQTYNLLFDASCIGKTAYCDGTVYENPEDSSKTAQAAFWEGVDPAQFGPVKCVTSIGNVVGTCVPSTTSSQSLFEGFLTNTLTNARTYAKNEDGTAKTDQQILDDTAKQLDLQKDDVEKAIQNTGVSVEWDKSKSTLPDGSNANANTTGDGSNNSNNNSSNNSGSSNKTGSGSTTKTGQESTVLFIMLGVMLAAAAVVVLARKERA